MTVCQYFLQGRCRYGQNCRFEHTYNTDNRNHKNLANSQQLNNVFKQIEEQIVAAEKGGQWPLSCFSPVQEGANIPGWEDISPDEVRWKMYEARAKGTLNQCINEINQLYHNAEKNRNLLKQPTMKRANLILGVLKGKKDIGNASNPFASSSSTNIFGGRQSSPQQNVFGTVTTPTGSHGTLFGGSPSSQNNIFGGIQTTQNNSFSRGTSSFSNQNIFGGSTTNFNQPLFETPPQTNQNIFSGSSSGNIFTSAQSSFSFAQPIQNSQNNFQSSGSAMFAKTTTSPIFGQNNFSQTASSTSANIFNGNDSENVFKNQNAGGGEGFTSQVSSGNVFGGQQSDENIFKSQQSNGNIFGGQQTNNSCGPSVMDSSVYSKVEELTEEDIKSFQAATFTFGKIPLKPPPLEYCN